MNKDINKKRVGVIVAIIIVLCSVIALLIFGFSNGYFNNKTTLVESASSDQTGENKISITGFSHLYLKANQTEQDVNFTNPASNTCKLNMALELSDGTVLWQTSNVMPGQTVTKIDMRSALPEGEYYNCCLNIRCFNIDSGEELNGCDICCTIIAE